MSQDNEKRLAAETAVHRYVENGTFKGGIIGVGTGSTVNFFIDALAPFRDKIKAAVSSSEASSDRLRKLGIDVLDLNAAIVQSGAQNKEAAKATLSDEDFEQIETPDESPQAQVQAQAKASLAAQTSKLPPNILQLLAE